MKALLSEKGQLTVPKAIRDQFGLHPGTEMEFRTDTGVIVLVKVVAKDPLDKWLGRAKSRFAGTSEDYMRQVRDADSD